MEKKAQLNFWYVAIAVMLFVLFQAWWASLRTTETILYSEFEELLKSG